MRFYVQLLSAFAICIMSFSATHVQAEQVDNATKIPENATRFVTAPNGERYEIPTVITRVAPTISSVATLTAMLGSEKIVAGIVSFSPFFKKVFPKYNEANPNNLVGGNIEEMIMAKPQVAYGPQTSNAVLAQYKAANIVFIPINVYDSIEDIQNNVNFVASILGGDAIKKAIMYQEYFNNNMKMVQEKSVIISAEKREKVMYVRFKGGLLQSSGHKDIAAQYIAMIGANNAMQDYTQSVTLSSEDIISTQATVIFINSHDGKNELLKNPALQSIPAIREKRVYVVPTGVYLWSVRTEETAMFPLWLASNIYPDVFANINMKKEVQYFYKTFYGYSLSDDEVNTVLSGVAIQS